MKKLLISLAGVLTIGAALPAIAGPDWQLIEQARKAKAIKMQRDVMQQSQLTAADTGTPGASASSQQMDKGSHMDGMMKECAEMMKKSA